MIKIDEKKILEELKPIIEKSTRELNLVALETTFKQESGIHVLRIYIYHHSRSITHEDCSHLTKLLSKELDEDKLIEVPYNLEVSSPGTNKKLKNPIEFEVFKNKQVKVILKKNDITSFKSNVLFGHLLGLTEDQKSLKIEIEGQEHLVDLQVVKTTQLDDRDL